MAFPRYLNLSRNRDFPLSVCCFASIFLYLHRSYPTKENGSSRKLVLGQIILTIMCAPASSSGEFTEAMAELMSFPEREKASQVNKASKVSKPRKPSGSKKRKRFVNDGKSAKRSLHAVCKTCNETFDATKNGPEAFLKHSVKCCTFVAHMFLGRCINAESWVIGEVEEEPQWVGEASWRDCPPPQPGQEGIHRPRGPGGWMILYTLFAERETLKCALNNECRQKKKANTRN